MSNRPRRSWRVWYWMVLIFLVAQILFYYFFTQYWS